MITNRLAAVENQGSSGSTALSEHERKLALIVGGWGADTRRDDLLKNVDDALGGRLN